ncbi:NAD(P)-binding domain-containing protein [Streptomyces sp. NPDC006654]|uniref:NADPH-dependent F420 reductase n=1 Tax=Streptomyces sp. NPDC006654 TaxID=3156897 RepID=UPI0034039064
MQIGIIGAGTIAQALAAHAIRAGHSVVLSNSRGPETLTSVVSALNEAAASSGTASAGTVVEAAQAPVVLLAVPWTKVDAALTGLPDWDGRILIDTTNHFLRIPPNPIIDDLGGRVNSEVVAEKAPGARVVKAFNAMTGRYVAADPVHAEGRQVVFYSGDDSEAKTVFADLVSGFGFAPIDVGTLHDGGRLMQLGGPLIMQHLLKLDD